MAPKPISLPLPWMTCSITARRPGSASPSLDLNADAEPLEQLFEIEAGRCLVVDDDSASRKARLSASADDTSGFCGAVAHDDPDPTRPTAARPDPSSLPAFASSQ